MKRKWMWILSGFLFLSALIFFPSWASVIMLVAAIIAVPHEKVASFLASRGLKGAVKGVLLAVMVVAAAMLVPSAPDDEPEPEVITESEETDAKQDQSEETELPTDNSEEPETPTETSQEEVVTPDVIDEPEEQPEVFEPEPEKAPAETAPEPQETVTADTQTEVENGTVTEDTSTPQTSGTYVGSIDSDKFHKPSCRWAKEILPENEIWFDSAEDARANQYEPCGTCKPS